MSRYLVAMFQGGGNIPLITPIVARLAARGHDVRVMAGPGVRASRLPVSERMREGIIAAGARLVPFSEPALHPLDAGHAIEGIDGDAIPAALRTRLVAETTTVQWIPAWAENVRAELRREPADALVADFVLVGALAAAEAGRVPAAALVHNASVAAVHGACHRRIAALPPFGLGFMPPRGPADAAEQSRVHSIDRRVHARSSRIILNRVRDGLGLPPLRAHCDQFSAADRVLILAPRAFDFPVRRLPANVRHVGTPFDDAGAPPWESPWPADDQRPLLLVSLSTLNQGQGDLMQRILTGAGSLPARVLATLGPALAARPFDLPGNVRIEPFVPHSAVLPAVGAIVSQCGLGTLMKALTHGVPVVCLPVLGDQPDNAARVAFHGAGLVLSRHASEDEIASACRRALADAGIRTDAKRLAASLAGPDAADTAADELESILAHDPRRGPPGPRPLRGGVRSRRSPRASTA